MSKGYPPMFKASKRKFQARGRRLRAGSDPATFTDLTIEPA